MLVAAGSMGCASSKGTTGKTESSDMGATEGVLAGPKQPNGNDAQLVQQHLLAQANGNHSKEAAQSHQTSSVGADAPAVSTATSTRQNSRDYAAPLLPPNIKVVFILGGPGCGKGTQSERIVNKFGYAHLSMGELLRAEVQRGSEMGRQVQQIMDEGQLVPTDMAIKLLNDEMVRLHAEQGQTKFLIDGFPRALDQAEAFEQQLRLPDLVLCLDCPLGTMQQRLMNRGRSDDNPQTIAKRFETFQKNNQPVLEHYEAAGRLVTVSSVPSPDEVFEEVASAVGGIERANSLNARLLQQHQQQQEAEEQQRYEQQRHQSQDLGALQQHGGAALDDERGQLPGGSGGAGPLHADEADSWGVQPTPGSLTVRTTRVESPERSSGRRSYDVSPASSGLSQTVDALLRATTSHLTSESC